MLIWHHKSLSIKHQHAADFFLAFRAVKQKYTSLVLATLSAQVSSLRAACGISLLAAFTDILLQVSRSNWACGMSPWDTV